MAVCERQQSLMQRPFSPKEGDGDTTSCSTDTSRWSISSSQYGDQYLSDSEDHLLTKKASVKPSGSQQSGFKKDKVRQGSKQKTNQNKVKLSPIKTMPVSKPRIPSASMNLIRELRSQVWDLQQQLSEATSENKLLKKIQHRHQMALQHFQDSEGSIGQILAKYNNEARALQKLLRETRFCRDNLTRQLHATERKLSDTKAALQHLKQLSQDQKLLEREELALRLSKATAESEDKDRRIQDMEKSLELCQASFKHQIAIEQRKVKEARNMSFYLQSQVHQLTKEIKNKEKEMEKLNIYYHRFLKGTIRKERENKMVQTDGLINITTKTSNLLELEYSENGNMFDQQGTTENWPCKIQEQEALVNESPEKKVSTGDVKLPQDTKMCTGPSVLKEHTSENYYLEESPERTPKPLIQQDVFKESKASDSLLDKTLQTANETSAACTSEESPNTTEAKKKKNKRQNIRHNYMFKQSIENLHHGLPAYSHADTSLPDTTATAKVEILGREIQDLCASGKFRGCGENKSPCESLESSPDRATDFNSLTLLK